MTEGVERISVQVLDPEQGAGRMRSPLWSNQHLLQQLDYIRNQMENITVINSFVSSNHLGFGR